MAKVMKEFVGHWNQMQVLKSFDDPAAASFWNFYIPTAETAFPLINPYGAMFDVFGRTEWCQNQARSPICCHADVLFFTINKIKAIHLFFCLLFYMNILELPCSCEKQLSFLVILVSFQALVMQLRIQFC